MDPALAQRSRVDPIFEREWWERRVALSRARASRGRGSRHFVKVIWFLMDDRMSWLE
jgi:hypothetical protein